MSIAYTLFDPNRGDIPLATALAATAVTGQKQTNPVISGGTIDGAVIGGTTPAAVAATTLSSSGLATLASAAIPPTGTVTANGATPVSVVDAGVTANSIIILTLKTAGGTVSVNPPSIHTITPATGFTIIANASDTSVYNYLRIG